MQKQCNHLVDPEHPMSLLPYNPGVLPVEASPSPGDTLHIRVDGMPPYKDVRQSIRNISLPRYNSFVDLRSAATAAMAGRAWYFGAVGLRLVIHAPDLHKGRSLVDYMAGVMDTIDGSSGFTFTYLPIVIEDDSQVSSASSEFVEADDAHYEVIVEFY